ncbi:MAG: gliding motility-associated C-terminal domain-containing protein [Bacteroidia bacterium]
MDTSTSGSGSGGPASFRSWPFIYALAFSPNNDGKNDVLRVRGNVSDMQMMVYNSWGELVFKASLKTKAGMAAIMGNRSNSTYVVIVSGHLPDGSPFSQHGQIHLIR